MLIITHIKQGIGRRQFIVPKFIEQFLDAFVRQKLFITANICDL